MANDKSNVVAALPRQPAGMGEGKPLSAFVRVVYAIMMREVRSRFGRDNMGYFRALIEPIAYLAGFALLWYLLDRATPIAVPIQLFFLASIFPYVTFRRAWSYTASALEANKSLLAFPVVQPLDFFIARTILELSTQILVFVILATAIQGLFCDLSDLPDNVLGLLLCITVTVLLGASFGLMLGCLAVEIPSITILQTIISRILLVTSGKFFLADSLPEEIQDIVWWNPVLHSTEWFRSAYFSEMDSRFLSIEYLLGCVVFFLTVGLLLERRLLRLRNYG